MPPPRCFPFRDILFVLNFIHLPVKVTGGLEARSSITLGNRIFKNKNICDITVEKKIISLTSDLLI
jgi:hypothetical protein